jgi:hypothetical protein
MVVASRPPRTCRRIMARPSASWFQIDRIVAGHDLELAGFDHALHLVVPHLERLGPMLKVTVRVSPGFA